MINVQTGEDFERLVLGISHVDIRNLSRRFGEYDFRASVAEVKKMQGLFNNWNPKRPKTELSMNLFQTVSSMLSEEQKRKLRLFVSVGTRLDFHFGTDCFFEISGSVATIDLTISNWKKCKANVLVRPIDIYDHQIRVAKRIVRFLCKTPG